MAKPSLIQVFGTNCTQTSTQLIIDKSDLASVGLTASNTNTAESLLMAIVLIAGQYLTETNQDTNADQVITIAKGLDSLVTRGTTQYKEFGYDIKAQIVDSQVTVDPDNF